MRAFLVGILAVGGWLATSDLALGQCCCMPRAIFFQPRYPTLIPSVPYFPTMTAYPSLPPSTPVYPSLPTVTANPSTALRAAIPKTTNSSSALPRTAITRESKTLVRSPGELEVKAQELFEKGVKAEQEENLFYAGTCYYHAFTFYRETSAAPRARNAYMRIEAQLERRPKSR